MNHLDAEYDYVAIIDFLPEADRRRHQLAQKLMAYLAKNGVEQNCLTCRTRKGFLTALQWLAIESQKGKKFMLQFIGHGETNGLDMPDDAIASWRQVGALLSRVRPETISRSILNMTCCWGINAIKIADHLPLETCFFGVLGPGREISFTEGYKVNTKLYKKMFAGAPVNQIVAEINNEFGQRILYNITAAGYRKLRKEQH
jgi:hypothetical protein